MFSRYRNRFRSWCVCLGGNPDGHITRVSGNRKWKGPPRRLFGQAPVATIVPGARHRSPDPGHRRCRHVVLRRRARHVHEIGPRGLRSGRRRQRHHLVRRTVGRVARMPPRHLAQLQVPRVHVLAALKRRRRRRHPHRI